MSTTNAPWNRRKEDREPWPADDIGAVLRAAEAATDIGADDSRSPLTDAEAALLVLIASTSAAIVISLGLLVVNAI